MKILLNRQFQEIEANYRLRGQLCGICGQWKTKLAQHVLTHTGSEAPLVHENGVTYNRSKADDLRRRKSGREEPHDPKVIELVRQMRKSTPSKVRHHGGTFREGPLRLQTVAGQPRYFEVSGRIKRRYLDVLDDRAAREAKAPARRMPVRKCNLPVPPSHANTKWDRAPAGETYTEIRTNLWIPGKYANWNMPGGFALGESPTWIPPGGKQCSLCDLSFCDCIVKRVSKARPSICSTGNDTGEGVRATVTYEKGELLGELVGDLAPLGEFSDGWAAELARNDVPGGGKKPASWCLVHPRHFGNWVRKVNHSCEPNCLFESMPISGRWRVMLKAVRRIDPGSWILVSYGDEYWQTPGRRCLCGSKNCISDVPKRT